MRIAIAPSTQTANLYAAGYGTEAQHMRALVPLVVEGLRRAGHDARNVDGASIYETVAQANRMGAELFLSCHSNATGVPGLVLRGCSTYVVGLGGVGEKLARAVYDRLSDVTPTADKGAAIVRNFYELRATAMPAALVEVDFHDNEQGAKWITENLPAIAQALIDGVLDVAGRPTGSAPSHAPVPHVPVLDLDHVQAAIALDSAKSTPTGTVHYGDPAGALALEEALSRVVNYAGPIDGSLGTNFVKAYAKWQQSLGYEGSDADGIPGRTSLVELGRRTGLFEVA